MLSGLPSHLVETIVKMRSEVQEMTKPYKDVTKQLRVPRCDLSIRLDGKERKTGEVLDLGNGKTEDVTVFAVESLQVIAQVVKPTAKRRVLADFSPESYAVLVSHIQAHGMSLERFFEVVCSV